MTYRFFDDLPAMCREVDILLLSCSGGEPTRNLVDAHVLEALGPKGTPDQYRPGALWWTNRP